MSHPLEEKIQSVKNTEEAFSRNITCKVYGAPEGVMSVSRFVDRFHDISLTMLIDPRTSCIKDADAVMDRVPYNICFKTRGLIKNLLGLSIFHRAVRREALKRIPRREGCTHLFELVEFTLAALFSGAPLAGLHGVKSPRDIEDEDPEEHRQRQLHNPWLKNTCRAFVIEENDE